MNYLMTLLLAAVSACGDMMPTRPDTFWTFKTTRKDKTSDATWTVTKLGDEKITLVDWVDSPKSDLMDVKFIDLKKDAKNFVAVREGGKIVMIVNNRGSEIRIFVPSVADYFELAWRLTANDLRDGKSITIPRAFLSCGFGIAHVNATVSSEELTVPAGTFRAFRIQLGEVRKGGETMWFVPGNGIVKWVVGDATMELSKWGVLKGGK